jgi:hypothetical protein
MIHAVLLRQGKYVCALCGEPVMAETDQRPLIVIRAASGEPNLRVISLEGRELHACPIDPARPDT